jgi:hypothetical protein
MVTPGSGSAEGRIHATSESVAFERTTNAESVVTFCWSDAVRMSAGPRSGSFVADTVWVLVGRGVWVTGTVREYVVPRNALLDVNVRSEIETESSAVGVNGRDADADCEIEVESSAVRVNGRDTDADFDCDNVLLMYERHFHVFVALRVDRTTVRVSVSRSEAVSVATNDHVALRVELTVRESVSISETVPDTTAVAVGVPAVRVTVALAVRGTVGVCVVPRNDLLGVGVGYEKDADTVAVTTPQRLSSTVWPPNTAYGCDQLRGTRYWKDAIELLSIAGNVMLKLTLTHEILTTTSRLRRAMPLCTTTADMRDSFVNTWPVRYVVFRYGPKTGPLLLASTARTRAMCQFVPSMHAGRTGCVHGM